MSRTGKLLQYVNYRKCCCYGLICTAVQLAYTPGLLMHCRYACNDCRWQADMRQVSQVACSCRLNTVESVAFNSLSPYRIWMLTPRQLLC
jgi:hypothetical protein